MIRCFHFVLLCCPFLLGGCSGEEWGQKFKDFVEDSVPSISRQLATSQFEKKWSRGFKDKLAFNEAILKFQVEYLNQIELVEPPENIEALSVSELSRHYVSQLNLISEISQINQQVSYTLDTLELDTSICSNKDIFYQFDLDSEAIRTVFATVAPEKNETYYASIDLVETVVFWVFELFSRSEREKQKELFDEGMAKLSQVIPDDKEMFKISENACEESGKLLLEPNNELKKGYISAYNTSLAMLRTQNRSLRSVEIVLIDKASEEVGSRLALDQTIENYILVKDKELMSSSVTISMFRWRAEVRSLEVVDDPLGKLIATDRLKRKSNKLISDLEFLEQQTSDLQLRKLFSVSKSSLNEFLLEIQR